LRFGAGIKGKLMDAMRCGTPSITTAIGAESMMSSGAAWGGAICDNATDYAAAAVNHYLDENLWRQKQQSGVDILREYFARADYMQLLHARIEQLADHVQREREANFIGQMLRHHHHKSTQYMGQWIEAKSQKSDFL
jgi:O-antigen biosynthesis protein